MDFQRKAEGKSGCTCCSLRLLCGGVSTCSHGCCVDVCVGSRDNRETIHTRSKCCLQPLSLNTCAFCSIISFSVFFFYPPCSLCQDCFILCIVSLSVFFCLSPTISFCLSARTEKQTQITAAGSCNSPSVELDSF